MAGSRVSDAITGLGDEADSVEAILGAWNPSSIREAIAGAEGHPLELVASDLSVDSLEPMVCHDTNSVHLLDLSRNPLVSLRGLDSLLQLRQLHLCGNEITRSLLSGLVCTSVLTLNLSEASIAGASDDDGDSTAGDDADAPGVAEAFPALLRLDLSYCDLSDNSLLRVSKMLLPVSVIELNLDGNALANASTLQRLAANVPGLLDLSLRDTPLLNTSSSATVNKVACSAFVHLKRFNGIPVDEMAAALSRPAACVSAGAGDVLIRDASTCSCLEGEPVRTLLVLLLTSQKCFQSCIQRRKRGMLVYMCAVCGPGKLHQLERPLQDGIYEAQRMSRASSRTMAQARWRDPRHSGTFA